MLASSGAWFTSRLAAASDPCDPANLNPIVCENSKPGDPVSEWDVGGAGDPSIQGFATDISVNRGQTISFKVKTAAKAYRIDMYRLGYYGGLGARRIATVTPSVSLPQSQPACLTDSTTGLIDCGNWAVSATWAVPAAAVSGIYVGRLVRTDTGGASHIVFIVRDDAGRSDILFQTADTTWQAYNQYGGNSLYVGSPAGRAYKVSYNRPFATRGTSPEDWLFNAEYPMVRWLEANGYDVSYSTGLDTDRRGAELVEHKILLSVGHDEYWSGGQRANVEAAREAGVHLAFFSGNEIFWKTRWENSIAGPTTAHRTLVAYKETHAGAKIDPDPQWTGTWRDPRFSPPADGGRPENALSGTLFMINDPCDQAIQVPAADGRMRFWRGTGVAALAPGQTATLSQSTLGYECDEDVDNGVRPQGLIRLSTTIFDAPSRLLDYGSTFGPGTANHALTLYKAPSGALVFGAGTVQWSWGLDGNHDRGGSPPDLTMQQATVNLFADMGVQPWTLDPALVAASPSSDAVSPTSVISSPENGASVPAGTDVTIAGTATDVGGGVVGGVEVSGDGGASWHPANGRENWTYVWTTPASGSVTIMSRAVDDSGNLQTAATSVTVNVGGGGGGSCPCSLWSVSTVPGGYQAGHDGAVELGVKFQATSAGAITGIRFYKGTTYSGPHTGSLWTNTGTLLATATFSSESASGWQQVDFATPVQIQANVTHVASYHKSSGGYYFDGAYFGASGVNRPPLRAPASGAAGGNGVYLYGPGGFPTNSYNATNYWVDVVFVPSGPTDSMPPTVTSVMPAAGSKAPTSTTVMTTFSEAMSPASINGETFELRDSANALVNSSVTYDGTTRTAVLTPTSALSPAASYVATVKGGTGGVKDVAGNPLASDYTWSFSTSGGRPDPKSGPGGPILLVTNAGDPFGYYYAEILRTEGLNEFAVADVSELSPGMLSSFDVVLLAQTALSPAQAATLRDWVNGGGNLVAMRPDAELATLLGLTPTTATMTDGYLLINTASTAGAGL
ncbi:MAG: DUF4082 domain-containing protein, partial [Acidobacteria bacterium]|nr:DUF4082 domain-containing protein [Acidobacteriota bacterium]